MLWDKIMLYILIQIIKIRHLDKHSSLEISFVKVPGDRGSIPGRVIPKTQKMVLDAVLLSTHHCKVGVKGKVEQSGEWSMALPYTSV